MLRAAAWAVVLAMGWVAVTLGSYCVARSIVAGDDYRIPALMATAALAVMVALGATFFGLWRRIGFTPWGQWRSRNLYLVPSVIALFPFAMGFGTFDAEQIGVLIVGYCLTGFAEEAFFRGILLEVLASLGPKRSAVLSSVLFGGVHLSNILIRGMPLVILSQSVGAACFGFGYAALRYRTGTVVPLILLHFLTDLFLHMGSMPVIPVAVAQDVVLLGFGSIILFRKSDANFG